MWCPYLRSDKMEHSPGNIETQIDCFLEQFKRSASKVMEDKSDNTTNLSSIVKDSLTRSRSLCLKFDNTTGDPVSFGDMVMLANEEVNKLAVKDVVDLLHPQYAISTGGKTKEGCPLLIFPDNLNFHLLTDVEYHRLISYLTSVCTMQEADLGFHIIIDRRKDRWNSVKTVLSKISGYFPGLIHVVYVIRPESFLQKALSEVSNKLFKEEFKFRLIVLSTVEELHEYVDSAQLTPDYRGTLLYNHSEWIKQRISLEKFSFVTKEVSNSLDEFTQRISETEFPNNTDATQQMLNKHSFEYSELKEEILMAAKHGESLLFSIKEISQSNQNSGVQSNNYSSDTIGNVFAVERLLVQLEETERTFDEFWQQHSTKLHQCLELRRFEQDFRELQINFDSHLKTMSEMTEVAETINRVETLIHELEIFQRLCSVDLERVEEVIASGQLLLENQCDCLIECVEPKCAELTRITSVLNERITRRMDYLVKCRLLMEKVEKANEWCTKGVDLLASQQIEKCSSSPELAEHSLLEIQCFLDSAEDYKHNSHKEFRNVFQDSTTPETKALVTQVLQRIDDVSLMCEKRIAGLKKISLKPLRPIQTVNPKPALPLKSSNSAINPHKGVLKKANTISKTNSSDDTYISTRTDIMEDDERKAKRGHVLAELQDTERVYVSELNTILMGYKREMESKEMKSLMPTGLVDKIDILFGNLDEIYAFHANVFLKDLENCITSIDLVALCFVQKRDMFYHLYSYYCQNIPRSEQLRESLIDTHMFFQTCQLKLGHKLPLAAYLLKPVQRITKYQLLLKDLVHYSDDGKYCKELQQALDCMLVVLKLVNDSMHQIAITGFPVDLSQQGELLLQGSFSVWTESKKDLRLRLKPMQRHIFLYQKVLLFCKQATKTPYNKTTYHFKQYLKMSQIGLTESVKSDTRKFEIWLQGRQEVHTIQAATIEQKQIWVNEIKRVLLNQLEELKGEKIKQYNALSHKPLLQMNFMDKHHKINLPLTHTMSMDSDCSLPSNVIDDNTTESIENHAWSSDYSNSEDEEIYTEQQGTPVNMSGRYIALADYCAVGNSEVSVKEGDILELLKVGCAGWWFVRVIGSSAEGWAPAAYLDSVYRKTSRSSSRSQDKISDNRE